MRLAFVLVGLLGCGGSNSAGPDSNTGNFPDAPTDPTKRYEPWKVGSHWSYKLTDPAGVKPPATGRVTTIGAMEDTGGLHAGQMAYKVHIETLVGSKDTWELPSGDLDIRYQTKYYDAAAALTETDVEQPYRLKLDESFAHTAKGAHYSETFTENVAKVGMTPTSKTETLVWSVIDDNASITVIAGAYTGVLHLQRYNASKMQTIDYWFGRGVGKLKELGNSTDEELESYTP